MSDRRRSRQRDRTPRSRSRGKQNRRSESAEPVHRRRRRSESRGRTERKPDQPRHRSRSRHRSASRRRGSTERCPLRSSSRTYDKKTSTPHLRKPFLELEYGRYPDLWRFVAMIKDIEAGNWGGQTAYYITVELSIEKGLQLNNLSLSLWLVPLLADGRSDPGADVKHYGPQFIRGVPIPVTHNHGVGGQIVFNAPVGPATANVDLNANNTTAFVIEKAGGLKTTSSIVKDRQKIFTEVYENEKSKSGITNTICLYIVLVAPKAVALDISGEVDVKWRKQTRVMDFKSSLKDPVACVGSWHAIPLPELAPVQEVQDFQTWKSDDYKLRATNDSVLGNNVW
ncbi:hypothetical protein QBC37DRAFT_386645 [Rhypophila decipiens]|uniref:Uncharacterized protein n=1 Tax=Rhypophila decipiens TaxID=261697 RepID=A0AAN6YE84_9PEZI|nr:hypothetical protein QBC37DRAFT_386645 [Rhypophila decipiens]